MPRPRKLPPREEIVRLYVEQNLSTPQIAKMFGVTDPRPVRVQLLRAGIKLRRHTVSLVCRIEGCSQPADKVRHEKLNSDYGTLCSDHRKEYYRLLNRGYAQRDAVSSKRYHSKLVENRATYAEIKKGRALLKGIKKHLSEMEKGKYGRTRQVAASAASQ